MLRQAVEWSKPFYIIPHLEILTIKILFHGNYGVLDFQERNYSMSYFPDVIANVKLSLCFN
jgi:hypothetical protein